MSEARDQLLDAWFRDLTAFAVSFDLRDKDLNTIPFAPTGPQRILFDAMDKHRLLQILKGRQIFATTAVLLRILRDCLRPGFQACVAVHNDQSAVEVGRFCEQLYRGNVLLQQFLPIERHREHRIRFHNDAQIKFGTANSEFWRGSKTHLALCTEAAMYDDLGGTLASLGQSVPASGRIILETTANGENDYYHMWTDPTSRYHKLFLSWTDHPEYSSKHPSYPDDGIRRIPDDLTEIERAYLRKSKLPMDRTLWALNKIRSLPINKRHLFEQEYPLSAHDAFILSGDKFLKATLPTPPAPRGAMLAGILRMHDYNPAHQYCAGVDTASGAESGDAHAVVIFDVTDRTIAATMEVRVPIPQFCLSAYALLHEYGSPVTVVEVNSYGLVVMDELRRQGIPQYMRTSPEGLASTIKDRHGWVTTVQTRPILYGAVFTATQGPSPISIGCPRLVNQLNALVYNKSGQPAAPTGQHDDLAVALGLALQGVDQAHPPAPGFDGFPPHAPRSVEEEFVFIAKYGIDAVRMFTDSQRDTAEFLR
ncbi:MAG: hypothetical protein FJ100_16210 [Deltaproteobacteria bacterium]|nr:hypothetical protein [Deltaproteobacteria bacterium]